MCFAIVSACFSSSWACCSSSSAIAMYCAPLSVCEYTTYAMIAWYSRERSSLRALMRSSRVTDFLSSAIRPPAGLRIARSEPCCKMPPSHTCAGGSVRRKGRHELRSPRRGGTRRDRRRRRLRVPRLWDAARRGVRALSERLPAERRVADIPDVHVRRDLRSDALRGRHLFEGHRIQRRRGGRDALRRAPGRVPRGPVLEHFLRHAQHRPQARGDDGRRGAVRVASRRHGDRPGVPGPPCAAANLTAADVMCGVAGASLSADVRRTRTWCRNWCIYSRRPNAP